MSYTFDALVIGAGIFGVAAALELNRRGYQTALLDPGPLPHPLAASTDISKVIRMEYGADAQYMAMVEASLPGWRQWNTELNAVLFHETGVTMLTRAPMAPGGYEYESYRMLRQRGHAPERLDSQAIRQRFPAWNAAEYVDGFYHAQGGYAESERIVAALLELAQKEGVQLFAGQAARGLELVNGRVQGVHTHSGDAFSAGEVIVAAGAWTPLLVSELAPAMRATGHPVFHLQTAEPASFTPPHFVVFTADIANSGWYGFPLHPRERVIKIANHGVGQRLHPAQDARIVTQADVDNLRRFLHAALPALAEAPIVYTRRCLYCDTRDEHLWIARHPTLAGLTVAAGGSGHGFKFAPVLGGLTADAVEGKPNPWLAKFRWRDLSAATGGQEAARYHG